MNADVDKEQCIGCSLCVQTCPEVFRMVDDEIAEAYAPVTPETEAKAREAAENCPVDAIQLDE